MSEEELKKRLAETKCEPDCATCGSADVVEILSQLHSHAAGGFRPVYVVLLRESDGLAHTLCDPAVNTQKLLSLIQESMENVEVPEGALTH